MCHVSRIDNKLVIIKYFLNIDKYKQIPRNKLKIRRKTIIRVIVDRYEMDKLDMDFWNLRF